MLKPVDLLRITIRHLLRQRGIGVLLSIAFGVSVYIAVTIMGRDVQNRIVQDVNLVGGVTMIRAVFEEFMVPSAPPQAFYSSAVETLRADPKILRVSASMRMPDWVPILHHGRSLGLAVWGVDASFWEAGSLFPVQGRLIGAQDVAQRARVCVLGEDTALTLFDAGPCIGRILTIKGDNYEVIGVVKGMMIRSRTQSCFIPLTTAMDRNINDAAPNRILLQMKRVEDVIDMAERLPQIVAAHQSVDYLKIEYSKDEVKKVQLIVRWVHFLLFLAIASALILGALGIWQGTFAAVRERTREIGLKLAMGAERRDILAQFLAEALFKSVLGGMLGIILGIGLIELGVTFMQVAIDWPALISTAGESLLVATLIGMIGGVYPAFCASRMDVVQALRYE